VPLTRLLAQAWCALLPLAAAAQSPRAPPVPCPARPAECTATTPVFNFGRHEMLPNSPPILAEHTVIVTCTKAQGQGFTVHLDYDLIAQPPEPGRNLHNPNAAALEYDLYVDPGRRQFWGDGKRGTKAISDKMELSDSNSVVTHAHTLYGTVHGQQAADPGHRLGFVMARLDYTIKRCR
jgi:spore coat protein U-like protein